MRRILNSFKEENPELIKEPRKFSIKLIDPWRIYKNDQPAVVRNSIPLCCVQNNYFFNILQAQTNDDNRKFEMKFISTNKITNKFELAVKNVETSTQLTASVVDLDVAVKLIAICLCKLKKK